MSSADNLRKDSEELLRLAQLTESVNVKRILKIEAEKLNQVALNEEKTASAQQNNPRKSLRSDVCSTKITNYGWDQSDKFLKIYVSISGVHAYPLENITCDFENRSFELHVLVSEKKIDNVLTIKNLLHEIIPTDSHFKVKTDMVIVYLKKKASENWSYVTEAEKRAKEPKTPKPSMKEDDPSAGLMTLMKQMYDEGDDDMKRTIAKAWTEARDKKTPDDVL